MKRIFLICIAILLIFAAGCAKDESVVAIPEISLDLGGFEVDTSVTDNAELPPPTENIELTPEPAVTQKPVVPSPVPEVDIPQTGTIEQEIPTDRELEALLTEKIASFDGSWAVYFKRLDNSELVSIADGPKVAASLVKLFVAGAYLEAVEKDLLGDEYMADLSVMITDSSNDACNRIIDALGNGDAQAGMAAVTEFAASIGCTDTQLNRKMLQVSDLENYTSVEDCAQVLENVVNGTFVNEEASGILLELLKQQSRTWKIPAGVPSEIETANKTGELLDVENDVAIVWSPECTYVLCIMVEDVKSPGTAQSNIASVSKLVYEYLNP